MWGLRGGSEGGEVNPPRFRTRMGIRGNGSYPTPHMMPYSTTTRKHPFSTEIQHHAKNFTLCETPTTRSAKPKITIAQTRTATLNPNGRSSVYAPDYSASIDVQKLVAAQQYLT